MAHILQLGAGELMKHSIRLIQQLGHRVYAVDRNPLAPAADVADGFAAIDLVDVAGVVEYARDISADAILAVNEAGVLTAAYASQRLKLRGLPPDVALRALDKGMMREAWRAYGLPQPDFRIVETAEQIRQAAVMLDFPIIVKPTMNWGSRGISRADSLQDLEWSIGFAVEHRRTGRFIVEQCVEGTEMTIEGLVQNGRPQILARSDKEHQAHPRFRVAMGLNYPANFSPMVIRRADVIIAQAVEALGIRDGAFHAEVMVRGEDVLLVEMGARPGGGHIFGQIVEAASGVCMPHALTQILLGEIADIRPKHQRGAVYRFFAPPPGEFVAVGGIEEARRMPGVLDLGFHMEPGTLVGAIAGDADRPGYIVTGGATRADAMRIADEAIASLHFRVRQPHRG